MEQRQGQSHQHSVGAGRRKLARQRKRNLAYTSFFVCVRSAPGPLRRYVQRYGRTPTEPFRPRRARLQESQALAAQTDNDASRRRRANNSTESLISLFHTEKISFFVSVSQVCPRRSRSGGRWSLCYLRKLHTNHHTNDES